MTEPAVPTSESAPGPGTVAARRVARALRVLAVFFLAPLLVGNLLGPPGAGWAACIGATVMLGASMADGLTAARRAAPVILVGLVLASLTTPGWGWALVLTALAAFSGLSTRWGAGTATSMATLVAVSAPAMSDVGQVLLLAAYAVCGGLFGWVAAARLGAPQSSRSPWTGQRRSVVIACGLAVATFVAAAIAILTAWPHASWIVVAVVVLGIPTPGLTERLMVRRMIGQLLACALVGTVAALTESTLVMLVTAGVVLVLYLMSLGGSITAQVTYLSAFFMLPIAATYAAPLLVVQRLAFNLLGLAILFLVVAAVRAFGAEAPGAGTEVSAASPPA